MTFPRVPSAVARKQRTKNGISAENMVRRRSQASSCSGMFNEEGEEGYHGVPLENTPLRGENTEYYP